MTQWDFHPLDRPCVLWPFPVMTHDFLRAGIMSSYVSIQGPWKFMVTSQILTHLDCWVKANNFWGQWGKTTRLSCCILKSSSRSKWILGIWAAACVCCPRQKCTWREMLNDDSCNHPCLKGCYCPQKYRQQHPTGKNKKKKREKELLLILANI